MLALTLASVFQRDVVLYNGSHSMPVGFYLRTMRSAMRGDVVTVRAVDVSPDIAAARDFTGRRDRFLKRVVAVRGDRVCASGDDVSINDAVVARRLHTDGSGRAMPTWTGCVTLADDVFLLGQTPDSFDGRYWGPTPRARIEGVWRPL